MHAIMFTFGLMLLGKAWTPLSLSFNYGLNRITAILLQGWLVHLNNPEIT